MESFVPKEIEDYCIQFSRRPSSTCEAILEHTLAEVPMPQMLCGPMAGSFLGFLVELLQAQKILEIGTFTGYSALAMAERMSDQGRLDTLDINPTTTEIAGCFWARSPHGSKIQSLLGPALETLEGLSGPYDLVFVDADKENYLSYVRAALSKLSTGGIIAVDNSLWSGAVLEPNTEDPETRGIQEMTRWVSEQPDLTSTLLPVRDGILLIQRRAS